MRESTVKRHHLINANFTQAYKRLTKNEGKIIIHPSYDDVIRVIAAKYGYQPSYIKVVLKKQNTSQTGRI